MELKFNTKLIVEYDGTNYSGWQRLGDAGKRASIQAVLEETLSEYLNEEIKIIGSGRTDAGVHAFGQTVNFHSNVLPNITVLSQELNKRLPEDIRICGADTVCSNFHSRYSAKSKTYVYRIATGETSHVFTRKYTCHIPEDLNVEAMEKAAAFLIGTHDYKSFTSEKNINKSTVRTIYSIMIYKNTMGHSNELWIEISGDGFLYNMVRIIVGTLLEVGKGTRSPNEVSTALEEKNRQFAGITMSSHALFLHHVEY